MIDKLTILLPHTLMALMIWRLMRRDDLDADPVIEKAREALALARRPQRRRKSS